VQVNHPSRNDAAQSTWSRPREKQDDDQGRPIRSAR